MKICNKCRKEKPELEFSRVRKGSEKRRAVCKECQTAELKKYAQMRRESRITAHKPIAKETVLVHLCKRHDCQYYGSSTGTCDYRLFTGQGRGCHGGELCSRYCKRTKQRTVRETAMSHEFRGVGVGEWL